MYPQMCPRVSSPTNQHTAELVNYCTGSVHNKYDLFEFVLDLVLTAVTRYSLHICPVQWWESGHKHRSPRLCVGVVCGHGISSVCIIYGWRVICRQRKTQRKAKERFDFWFQLQSELLQGKERKSAEGLILFSGYFCLHIYSDLADLGLRVAWNTFTFRMTVCLCNTRGQGRASTNSTGQSDWFARAKWWLMFWANTSLDNM